MAAGRELSAMGRCARERTLRCVLPERAVLALNGRVCHLHALNAARAGGQGGRRLPPGREWAGSARVFARARRRATLRPCVLAPQVAGSLQFAVERVDLSAIIAVYGSADKMNTSHTVTRLAFGPPYPGLINPLEGVRKIITTGTRAAPRHAPRLPCPLLSAPDTRNTHAHTHTTPNIPPSHAKPATDAPPVSRWCLCHF